jgi:hypothetical protein
MGVVLSLPETPLDRLVREKRSDYTPQEDLSWEGRERVTGEDRKSGNYYSKKLALSINCALPGAHTARYCNRPAYLSDLM